MTKVLVHGNPETAAIWGPLTSVLATHGIDDIVTVSPPGFGSTVPDGWDALPSSYVTWLATELEALKAAGADAIDLVGHDWGAGHVAGLAAARPDLIRSWAIDCGGLLNPDYVWHDAAQMWQTPDVGEDVVAAMVGPAPADKMEGLIGLGMTEEIAASVAEAMNEDMGACILGLYRGAVPPMLTELADRLAAADQRPKLIIDAADDPYVATTLVPAVVERFGADHVQLAGQGHWWMISDPEPAAAALVNFWNGLSRASG